MSNAEAAVLYVLTFVTLMECFFIAYRIWRERPMVGRDPNTGHYRSVRRMARERAR